MLDLNKLELEDYIQSLKISLQKRNITKLSIDELQSLVKNRKQLITDLDTRRAQRNQIVNEYKGQMPPLPVKEELALLKDKIVIVEKDLEIAEEKLMEYASHIPNILHHDVPLGANELDNVEISRWGTVPHFTFDVKSHDVLGEQLGVLDIPRGVKLSGSRFYTLKNQGALLERALANFFLDEAVKAGYTEMMVPVLVQESALFGTGQLPKFKMDLFKIENEIMYLIPTAEVPLTNLYSKEILKESDLPMYFTAYTSCFRKEAGSYGKDTRGIFRVHQFQKVELVKYVLPEKSEKELEQLTDLVATLLEKLQLPYRKMLLCGGDTGFAAEKTYDFEVYLPFEKQYREISSCSLFGDFQSRRAQLKYKSKDGKNLFFHTINGSGLAIGRTWIAIMENFQKEDGSVTIPEVLRPYMQGLESITLKNKKD